MWKHTYNFLTFIWRFYKADFFRAFSVGKCTFNCSVWIVGSLLAVFNATVVVGYNMFSGCLSVYPIIMNPMGQKPLKGFFFWQCYQKLHLNSRPNIVTVVIIREVLQLKNTFKKIGDYFDNLMCYRAENLPSSATHPPNQIAMGWVVEKNIYILTDSSFYSWMPLKDHKSNFHSTQRQWRGNVFLG